MTKDKDGEAKGKEFGSSAISVPAIKQEPSPPIQIADGLAGVRIRSQFVFDGVRIVSSYGPALTVSKEQYRKETSYELYAREPPQFMPGAERLREQFPSSLKSLGSMEDQDYEVCSCFFSTIAANTISVQPWKTLRRLIRLYGKESS